MLRFEFTVINSYSLSICNSPAKKGKKTIGVSRKQSGWNNNNVKKLNPANNAIEHWDIYFSFV